MKKLITLFLIITVIIASSFASEINILSSVELQHLSATIIYNENSDISDNNLEIISEYSLDEEIAQSTKAFSVIVNGNTSETETITVTIEATPFTSSNHTTTIVPVATALDSFSAFIDGSQATSLIAGVYTNQVASQFTLNWMGQSELPNGEYYSTVKMSIVNPN
jgi:hypothetical protein